ncbi:MAG TPA: hypothetical protein V6C63_19220 [Allocoleopsis sp.]
MTVNENSAQTPGQNLGLFSADDLGQPATLVLQQPWYYSMGDEISGWA